MTASMSAPEPAPATATHGSRSGLGVAALGALGVVYGDIGTSPLYAIKECLAYPHSPHAVPATPDNVLGVLSLIFWALVLIICLKYLVFVLRADNHGEGGILALAALVTGERDARGRRLAIATLLGLFGAGLLFGDGLLTPAISVLGAMEGLSEQNAALTDWIVPITIAILVGLFLVQRHGTGRIGVAFGPVILVWFVALGAIGLGWIITEPAVLGAVDPRHAARFVATGGYPAFLIIGLVFLVVTGGEALYADLGHFGKGPIRLAWFTVALPGLLLNYFGQGAMLLTVEPGTIKNPFYAAAPAWALLPMLVLATMAATIASQALISGVFSLTRQAMQLGFWPRLTVVHTSAQAEGQIYIPEMNWLMMLGTVAVVLQFRTTSNIAAAYGIAVTATMAITSTLFFLVAIRRWGWTVRRALVFLIPFLAIDLAFFASNSTKFLSGGWFPFAVAGVVFVIMTTWWRGRRELAAIMAGGTLPEPVFLADLGANPPDRVDGTAVFMTSGTDGIPTLVLHHLKHNRVLHRRAVLFSVITLPTPFVHDDRRLEVRDLGHGFARVIARVGFMETPDVPRLLARCAAHGIVAEPMTTTYYLGRETLLTTGKARFGRWRKALFAFLSRNARPPTAFFNLPPNRVVELGAQIEL